MTFANGDDILGPNDELSGTVEEGSPVIQVDFSKVGAEAPPGSHYLLSVSTAKSKRSSKKGLRMISLTCVIEEPEEHAGLIVYDNLMLEGLGLPRTKAAFEAILGSAAEQVSLEEFVGRQFYASLDVTTYTPNPSQANPEPEPQVRNSIVRYGV